jgi:hypothetical protein
MEGVNPGFEILYFSVSTMVKVAPQYDAVEWCRWVVSYKSWWHDSRNSQL